MSIPRPQPDELFQPGQVGMRHLLGAMTVVGVALGVAAARLRTLSLVEGTQVAAHWALLVAVVTGTFYFNSRRLRHNRAAAGGVLLRALNRPMTASRRQTIAVLLTIGVVCDGIFVCAAAIPARNFAELWQRVGLHFNWLFYLLVVESLLWGSCLNHWLTNVYWVEFREHGLLTHTWYLPWSSITRIGWAPAHPQNLVIIHGGIVNELPIDPASCQAVDEVLGKVRLRANS